MTVDPERLTHLRYEDFKDLARETGLSEHERIGFPDAYREGQEEAILRDLRRKASNLETSGRTVLDVGCGCGALATRLIDYCESKQHRLILVDSEEVFARLPEAPNVLRVPGRFPQETGTALSDFCGKVDVIIAYSVLHYVVIDANPFDFVDRALELLAPQGQLLVGDIPNLSMRRRFFSSASGRAYHRAFTRTDADPEVVFNTLVRDSIDDSVLLA
jgi:2-polyprenyl-3-methyl-5-hydroxy-6-metoxy-1,4-benzoquinol methylase